MLEAGLSKTKRDRSWCDLAREERGEGGATVVLELEDVVHIGLIRLLLHGHPTHVLQAMRGFPLKHQDKLVHGGPWPEVTQHNTSHPNRQPTGGQFIN